MLVQWDMHVSSSRAELDLVHLDQFLVCLVLRLAGLDSSHIGVLLLEDAVFGYLSRQRISCSNCLGFYPS